MVKLAEAISTAGGGVNSRAKGKVGELEWAAFLREHGFDDARRGQQFKGGGDSPDVVGMTGFHPEVKRVEEKAAGTIYDWLAQAVRDAAAGLVPLVAHRRNRKEWVVILRAEDFLKLVGEKHG
jgi:Holliday junction resolvase